MTDLFSHPTPVATGAGPFRRTQNWAPTALYQVFGQEIPISLRTAIGDPMLVEAVVGTRGNTIRRDGTEQFYQLRNRELVASR